MLPATFGAALARCLRGRRWRQTWAVHMLLETQYGTLPLRFVSRSASLVVPYRQFLEHPMNRAKGAAFSAVVCLALALATVSSALADPHGGGHGGHGGGCHGCWWPVYGLAAAVVGTAAAVVNTAAVIVTAPFA